MLKVVRMWRGIWGEKKEVADFLMGFAQAIRQGSQGQSWRLQSLTDLSELPPYAEANQYGGFHGRGLSRLGWADARRAGG